VGRDFARAKGLRSPTFCSQNDGDAVTGVHNRPESLDSKVGPQSNGLKYEAPISADLLHPYFRADRRLLTVSEVADRLGLCAATVYKLCASGALHHVRVLNSIRVAEEWLQLLVEERTADPRVTSPSAPPTSGPTEKG